MARASTWRIERISVILNIDYEAVGHSDHTRPDRANARDDVQDVQTTGYQGV